MSNKNKSIFLFNTFIMNGTSVIEKGIFFVINMVIARYLTRAHFGQYTTALGFATFFSIFTSLGITQSLIRSMHRDKENITRHLANTLFIKSILSVSVYIIMAISLFIAMKFNSNYSLNVVLLALIFGIVRIGSEYLLTFYAFYNGMERFGIICFFTNFTAILIIGSTFLVKYLSGNYFLFATFRLSAVLISLLLVAIYTFKKYKNRIKLSIIKEFITQTIPFGVSNIYDNIIQRANIILLSFLVSTPGKVGIFSNGYMFLQTLLFIPMNFGKLLVPRLYKHNLKNDLESFQFYFALFTKLLAIGAFYTMIVMQFYGLEIVTLIFGDKYLKSADVLKICAFAIPFVFNITNPFLISIEKQKQIMKVRSIAAVVNIISCLTLGYFFEAEGVSVTMVITFTIIYLLNTYELIKVNIAKVSFLIILFLKLILISLGSFYLNMVLQNYTPLSHFFIRMIIISIFFGLSSLLFVTRGSEINMILQLIFKKKGETNIN